LDEGTDEEDQAIYGMETHTVSDDEEPVTSASRNTDGIQASWPRRNRKAQVTTSKTTRNDIARAEEVVATSPFTFDLDGAKAQEVPLAVVEEQEHLPAESPVARFQAWHHKLNHLSPRKMQTMAKLGILPKALATCEVPICPACLYGKATKRPWRTKPGKGENGKKLRVATTPEECVSVDQLESTTLGLIAQVKGCWMTTKRYRAATVFVDHYSGLSYVHLQKSTDAKETIEAKVAFERYAAKSNVQVQHYHADNGRFAENDFKAAVEAQGQTISFCGVNAHFQNAVAERRI
jgi:hypothetical protein